MVEACAFLLENDVHNQYDSNSGFEVYFQCNSLFRNPKFLESDVLKEMKPY